MFDTKDFKEIINNTTALIGQLNNADEDDIEELQIRIDSNIQALRIVGAQITDPSLREQAQNLIRSMGSTVLDLGTEEIITRIRRTSGEERSELITGELYKNAAQLKSKAALFGESLKTDKKILEKITGKITKSSAETGHNLNILEETGGGIGSSTYLFLAFVIFVVMYFVVRFL